MEQNTPNPFNPSTNIAFTLEENSYVRLIVYDMLGREVKVLVDELKQAGSYSAMFNAADLPSGVYIYKLNAVTSNGNVFNEVKKMILLK
jgi:hypothetical protein